jgi:hypothetical protein
VGSGEEAPRHRIRGTRFRVIAAPTQVGVETHTRGLVSGGWGSFSHAKVAKGAKPRQECGAGPDAGRGRDACALTRTKSAKEQYHFLGASVREKISHRNTGGGGKSRKGKGWAEPKPKEQIVDKCKFIRIILRNE